MSDQPNPQDASGAGTDSADDRGNQDCPNLSTLTDWIRQKLNEQESAQIETHVAGCNRCQDNLNELTDDPKLPRSGRDLTSHDGSPSFSDEPHFQQMRKDVRKRLTELDERRDASRPHGKPRLGRTDEKALGIAEASENLTNDIGDSWQTIAAPSGLASSVAVEQDSTIDVDRPRRTLPAEELPSIAGLRIEKQIGQGGFGHVYLAWDERLSRSVAVKTIDRTRLNSRNRERFFREARSIAAIDHPHVVKVFGVGNTDEELPYLAMEYVAGGTLYSEIGNDDELTMVDVKRAVRYVRDAGLGLQAVHAAGLVHRDLKPANILIDRNLDGTEDGVAKLADFGLVKYLDEQSLTLTRAAELVGTPAYMSPEQASESDELDARSDVYSLGATLYHAITGQPLFGGSSIAIIRQISESQPIAPRQLNPNVAEDLETVCLRAISKEPAKRYPTATAMTEDLDRFLNGQPVQARKVSTLEKVVYWSKQHRGLATTMALLLATMITGTIASTTLWLKANVAEKQAVADRTVVLDSMTNLVDSLYDDLSNNAASIKSRESVLEAAISGLNSIAQVKADEAADRTTMLAQRRLAHLMQLKGSLDEAENYYESALSTARARHTKNSSSTETLNDLATATLDLATFLATSGQDDARVGELEGECRSLLDQILTVEPNHYWATKHVVNLHNNRLNAIFRAGTPAQAIEEAPEILNDLEKLVSLDATRSERDDSEAMSEDGVNLLATDIHFAIGRAHFGSSNIETAKQHFYQARTFLEKRLLLTPNNQSLMSKQATLDRADGLAATSLGQHESAIRLFEQATTAFQMLVDADPDDTTHVQQLANSYALTSNAHFNSSQFPEAIQCLEQADEIYAHLHDNNPQDNILRALWAESHFKRAQSELYLNQWAQAANSYRRTIELLTDDAGQPLQMNFATFEINLSKACIEAIGLLTGQKNATHTPEHELLAILFIARKDATAAESEELSTESIELIKQINPGIEATTFSGLFEYSKSLVLNFRELAIYRVQFEARANAMIARNIAQSTDAKPSAELTNLQRELCEQSVQTLKGIAAMVGEAKQTLIFDEPDLTWLRTTREFKEAFTSKSSDS